MYYKTKHPESYNNTRRIRTYTAPSQITIAPLSCKEMLLRPTLELESECSSYRSSRKQNYMGMEDVVTFRSVF